MKKKLLASLLAATMVASLAACGNEEGSQSSGTGSQESTAESTGTVSDASSDSEQPEVTGGVLPSGGARDGDYRRQKRGCGDRVGGQTGFQGFGGADQSED